MRALLSSLAMAMAMAMLPATAGAATVRVVPYPPDLCERPDRGCPVDMAVFTAAPGEANHVRISFERVEATAAAPVHFDLHVRDGNLTPLLAGSGCAPVGQFEVVCETDFLGPVELGDREDRIITSDSAISGVSGGAGDDVLDVGARRTAGRATT